MTLPRWVRTISAVCRNFSTLRITCAVARSAPNRSSTFNRLATYRRSAGVTAICRPTIVTRIGAGSEESLPLARGRDIDLGAVLRDSPTRDHDVIVLKAGGDFLIFQRMGGVFLGDHFANHFADRD